MDVQAAASALSESASSHKIEIVNTSLRHVLEAVKLLDLSSPSPNIIEKIGSRLRKPLLPLYQHCTDPALRFCSATLNFISVKKVQPALLVQANSLVVAWQSTQSALLSGVLDFIERNPTNENKKHIATGLYPVLCDGYFLKTPSEHLTVGVDLVCSAYILLTESASLNSNRLVLQDSNLLGAKRIGATLAGCKDYLAIEALLELFASILPPTTKGANDKRRRFLQLVFDPMLFAGSAQLIKILSSPSTTDWETLSVEIIATLSKSDITFPQPFKIKSLQVADTFPNVDNTIYLDNKGFTSNIDENGSYETFHIPFTNVQKIKFNTTASSLYTIVTAHLTAFPIIDRSAETRGPTQNATIVFQIASTEKERFIKGLTARKLGPNITSSERKASKLNVDLPLNFTSNGQSFPEKAERVLGVEASSDYHLLQTPSALGFHGISLPTPTDMKSLDLGGDQDDIEPKPPRARRAQNHKAVESDDEVQEILPVSVGKTTRHSTKPQPSEQQPSVPAERIIRTFPQSPEHAPKKPLSKAQGHRVHFRRTEHTSPYKAVDGSEFNEEKSKPIKDAVSSHSVDARNSLSKKRRRTAEIEDDEDEDSRASKRPKLQSPLHTETTQQSKSPIFKKSVIAPRRYKRKGRTSSPTPSKAADTEYDEIPFVASVATPKQQVTSNGPEDQPISAPCSTRLSAMKGRGGKAPGKSIPVKTEPPPTRNAKDAKTWNTAKNDQKEAKPARRSERVKKVVNQPTKANTVIEYKSPTPVKLEPRDNKPSSETNADMNTVEATIQIALVPDPLDPSPTDYDWMETETYTDFIVPIEKPTSDISLTPAIVKKSATMIDLTLDDSPRPTTKRSRDKQRQNPMHTFTFDPEPTLSSKSDDSIAKKSDRSLDVSSKVLITTRRTAEKAEKESTTPSPTSPHSGPVDIHARSQLPAASQQASIRYQQPVRTTNAIVHLDRDPAMVHTTVSPIRQPTVTIEDGSPGFLPSALPSSAKAPAGISRPYSTGNVDPINRARRQENLISHSDRNQSPTSVELPVKESSSAKARTPHHKQKFDVPSMSIPSRGPPLFDKTNAPKFPFRTEQYSPPKVSSKYARPMSNIGEVEEYGEQRHRRYEEHDKRSGHMDHDIIQVLGDIQDVIVDKISRRFDHVKTDVRAGRNIILREAAAELKKMQAESMQHYSKLLDFESEYSSYTRNFSNGLEELHKVNLQITRRIEEVLQTHDRRSLSKVFPALSSPPSSVLRPSL
ncbi:hypothetical protein F5146DRAFT_1014979 [Armillaria mellea]|nr:hypothetical protein F5146DRAFT_1014979 [Armillaria mellea]